MKAILVMVAVFVGVSSSLPVENIDLPATIPQYVTLNRNLAAIAPENEENLNTPETGRYLERRSLGEFGGGGYGSGWGPHHLGWGWPFLGHGIGYGGAFGYGGGWGRHHLHGYGGYGAGLGSNLGLGLGIGLGGGGYGGGYIG